MRTFPGSLNDYRIFIEDFAIDASVLYEKDIHKISRTRDAHTSKLDPGPKHDRDLHSMMGTIAIPRAGVIREGRNCIYANKKLKHLQH